MTTLSAALPLLKLALVFAAMLAGIRCKLGLGLSALGGSFLLALCFDVTPAEWFWLSLGVFSDRSIITVWVVIVQVLALSFLMENTGQAERFMNALSSKISSTRLRMVFFPVLIGLLPMPGGAVFSAPMISAVARGLPVPEDDKSLINYWFRHSAEMSWPLFPSLILAAGLAGLSTPGLVAWTAPLSLAYVGVGWFFLVRPLNENLKQSILTAPVTPDGGGGWGEVLRQGAPLVVALGGALLLEVIFALFLPQIPMDNGVLLALGLAVFVCLRQNNLGVRAFVTTVLKPSVLSMIFIVGALGVFKNVLTEGGVVQSLLTMGTGVTTLWFTALVMPLLVGALTGLMMASVGSVFPLLVALAQTVDGAQSIPAWTMLGMAATLTGCMISPLHICFVLSCEYFKVGMTCVWRRLPAPALMFLLIAVGYFLCIR